MGKAKRIAKLRESRKRRADNGMGFPRLSDEHVLIGEAIYCISEARAIVAERGDSLELEGFDENVIESLLQVMQPIAIRGSENKPVVVTKFDKKRVEAKWGVT